MDSALEQALRTQIERLPTGLRPKLDRGEKIFIVDNPSASSGRYAQHGERAQQIYQFLGYDCQRVITAAPGDGVELARRAAEDGATLVMPCSGDGGVREVAMGLMQIPAAQRPKFSVLPKGTVNVFARTLRLQVGPIPDVFHACLKQIFWARTTRVDVARLNGVPFVCFAGFGYDATVIENVPATEKRNFREWAYVSSAFRTLFGWGPEDKRAEPYVPVRMRVRAPVANGEPIDIEGYFVAIGNVEDYGPGWFPLHPQAKVDDGLLDVLVIASNDKMEMVRIAAAVLRRAHVRNPNVHYFQTPGPVQIDSLGDPVPTHADCELVGRSSGVQIAVEPGALEVLY